MASLIAEWIARLTQTRGPATYPQLVSQLEGSIRLLNRLGRTELWRTDARFLVHYEVIVERLVKIMTALVKLKSDDELRTLRFAILENRARLRSLLRYANWQARNPHDPLNWQVNRVRCFLCMRTFGRSPSFDRHLTLNGGRFRVRLCEACNVRGKA